MQITIPEWLGELGQIAVEAGRAAMARGDADRAWWAVWRASGAQTTGCSPGDCDTCDGRAEFCDHVVAALAAERDITGSRWRHKGTGVEVVARMTHKGTVMATCAGRTGNYSEHPAIPLDVFIANYTRVT